MANKFHINNKIFNEWNEEKKKLDEKQHIERRFREKEVWWCSIGKNIGEEQDGKNSFFERPILIFKKFNDKVAWVIPMTSSLKSGKYYHALCFNGHERILILSQLKLMSTKRLRRKIGSLPSEEFEKIREKIIRLI